MLLAPEPHIPVNPDVASIPEVVDIPEVADIADEVEMADDPDDIDGPPGVVVVAPAIPPPSYVVGDPNVPSGEVATVEHAAPLLASGTAIVPVSPLGTVLPPGDAPGAKPFGPIDTPGKPSEEVAPSGGMAVVMPACAKAGLWHSRDQVTATINNGLMKHSPRRADGFAQGAASTAAAEPTEAMTLCFIATAHTG
jgi:hypothetical protein